MGMTAHKPPPNDTCDDLIRQLESLRREIGRQAESSRTEWAGLPPARRASAENLVHYLALRSRDLRPLQDRLARLGLSSLGRAEPHVLATLDAVLRNLYLLGGRILPTDHPSDPQRAGMPGSDRLEKNTLALLGPHPKGRRAHIMVTMPAEAADDYLMVHQLLKGGMNCLRINCAHDDPVAWARMIEHLKNAERVTARDCPVLMDLGGPKLRTGPMVTEPAVIKVRPQRNSHGHVVRPARIWLTSPDSLMREMEAADACLAVDGDWLAQIATGDRIRLRDVRGSRRNWRIREVSADGCWAESNKTVYLANGTMLSLRGEDGDNQKTGIRRLPPQDCVIRLKAGDMLLMSGSDEPGKPSIHDDNGEMLSPGRVSLPIPEIYRDAHPGERVFFDDGRIGGIIEKVDPQQLQIRVTHTRRPQERLAGDKGVNLPDTQLNLPALSIKDLRDLEFAARHADLIGLSFTNGPGDVRALRKRLLELGREDCRVILKIETNRGFANLPGILLAALKFPACGVMIARGDLAVECGFERLAEVQEEILWISEAAHVPVIWATQVLEGLTKRGHVSRAEITDAAMSQSAECVMLNKGPHIIEAVRTLDDVLRRMQGHHSKKRSMLRELRAFHGPG